MPGRFPVQRGHHEHPRAQWSPCWDSRGRCCVRYSSAARADAPLRQPSAPSASARTRCASPRGASGRPIRSGRSITGPYAEHGTQDRAPDAAASRRATRPGSRTGEPGRRLLVGGRRGQPCLVRQVWEHVCWGGWVTTATRAQDTVLLGPYDIDDPHGPVQRQPRRRTVRQRGRNGEVIFASPARDSP